MDNFTLSKNASRILANATIEERNNAIKAVMSAINAHSLEILKANKLDVDAQIKQNASPSFIDRLTLTKERIDMICDDMIAVTKLDDPLNRVLESFNASDLLIKKVSVPFGVIGVIYEARPNVTVDVFTLCLKTGNCCLLKGGKDAENTNNAIVNIIREALKNTMIPIDSVILMPSDRQSALDLITARGKVDLVVPRGSKQLIDFVTKNSLVSVFETGAGVCHTYVSDKADLNQALKILINAKTSRPSVCNACETLIVHTKIANKFLNLLQTECPKIVLHGENNEIFENLLPLTDLGYNAEYGSLDLSVKVVDSVPEAVKHINEFSTKHSDCICTTDEKEAEFFLNGVDSACVYWNASTRFSDGGCFGFGAELGISTQKNHPRGPMGLKEMTSYKYKIYGKGQVR